MPFWIATTTARGLLRYTQRPPSQSGRGAGWRTSLRTEKSTVQGVNLLGGLIQAEAVTADTHASRSPGAGAGTSDTTVSAH